MGRDSPTAPNPAAIRCAASDDDAPETPLRIRRTDRGHRHPRRASAWDARAGDRARLRRLPGEPGHHDLARHDSSGRESHRRTGRRHQRQRRQSQLRPKHRQQHLEVHHRPRCRRRRLRRVRPGHRIHRLREREREPGTHSAERGGEGSCRQGSRSARRLRHRNVGRRRRNRRHAARPARTQLGREHLHPQRNQRNQPFRREQAEAAGLGTARGAAAGRAGVGGGGADRRAVGGGVLPVRLGGDGD